MPSTYTPSLKLEIIANGEQSTTWGETTNNNMGTLIEQAITGVQPITLTGNTELTNYNGLSDQSRNAVLVFNGSLANAANVTIPSATKTYIVSNKSGANVTVKTSSGNGVTLSNNVNSLIYCDGTYVYTSISTNIVRGDLSVSGNQTTGGSFTAGGNITINSSITSNSGTLGLTGASGVVAMNNNSGAFTPPYGATEDRPATPINGMTRWNSTGGYLEIWTGIQWQNITGNYSIDYLVVAGGGGGCGGGGGAGGLLSNSTTVTVGTSYSIVVGSGGAGTISEYVNGANGTNSTAFTQTAIGGGGGGNTGVANNGSAGGSGGGAGQTVYEVFGSGGAGTAGQGNNGGANVGVVVPNGGAGGGGGAGAVGSNGTTSAGGAGGNGLQSSITGTATYYAGGGGGGSDSGIAPGGAGGGGGGAGFSPGTAGTGGGGGAFYGNGGSGVVILRYASASQRGTGGTVTSYSDAGITYFVHTFTTSGTFTA